MRAVKKVTEDEYMKYITACEKCTLPRKLSLLFYEEDLRVVQRKKTDFFPMEAVCPRCHDMEMQGRSKLRLIEPYAVCVHCKKAVWDYGCAHGVDSLCANCTLRLYGVWPRLITEPRLVPTDEGKLQEDIEFWKFAITQIVWMIRKDDVRTAVEFAIAGYEDGGHPNLADMAEIPSRGGYVRRDTKHKSNDLSGMEDSKFPKRVM